MATIKFKKEISFAAVLLLLIGVLTLRSLTDKHRQQMTNQEKVEAKHARISVGILHHM